MAIKVQKNIVNRVDIMVRNMVAELAQVVKKQYDQQVPIIMYNNNNINNNTYEVSNNLANNNKKQYSSQDPFTLLPSAKLYNYLSKMNELQQFESFSTFLNFEIKCF